MSEHNQIYKRALLCDLIVQLQRTEEFINFGQVIKVAGRTYHVSIVEQVD